jgi:hypothetical protein
METKRKALKIDPSLSIRNYTDFTDTAGLAQQIENTIIMRLINTLVLYLLAPKYHLE